MKANKTAALLVSELFTKRVIDESAETSAEVAAKNGIHENTAQRKIRKLLESGVIEQVWKRVGRNVVPAYRTKK